MTTKSEPADERAMIELDGSQGEGGGQILRTSLALAMCTGRPVRLARIRAKRSKPGLMRQHLACVQAAQAVSEAVVEGAALGSQDLVFRPGAIRAGEHRFAIGTAGSCTLVLQTVLPALLQAPGESRLTLCGGTHNPMAPPFHFIERAFLPLLRRMGADVDVRLRRHGFYPAGGGEMSAVVRPVEGGLRALHLPARGAAVESYAECLAPGLHRGVMQRELHALGEALGWSSSQWRTSTARQDEGPGNALMATLVHDEATEVFTAFGEKGVSAEDVAKALAVEVLAYTRSAAAVGPHLADQLALPLALAVASRGGRASYTCSEATEHTRTNLRVIEAFLPVRSELVAGERLVQVTIEQR